MLAGGGGDPPPSPPPSMDIYAYLLAVSDCILGSEIWMVLQPYSISISGRILAWAISSPFPRSSSSPSKVSSSPRNSARSSQQFLSRKNFQVNVEHNNSITFLQVMDSFGDHVLCRQRDQQLRAQLQHIDASPHDIQGGTCEYLYQLAKCYSLFLTSRAP